MSAQDSRRQLAEELGAALRNKNFPNEMINKVMTDAGLLPVTADAAFQTQPVATPNTTSTLTSGLRASCDPRIPPKDGSSPFMKLPVEIRRMIFRKYLLPDKAKCIQPQNHRLRWRHCKKYLQDAHYRWMVRQHRIQIMQNYLGSNTRWNNLMNNSWRSWGPGPLPWTMVLAHQHSAAQHQAIQALQQLHAAQAQAAQAQAAAAAMQGPAQGSAPGSAQQHGQPPAAHVPPPPLNTHVGALPTNPPPTGVPQNAWPPSANMPPPGALPIPAGFQLPFGVPPPGVHPPPGPPPAWNPPVHGPLPPGFLFNTGPPPGGFLNATGPPPAGFQHANGPPPPGVQPPPGPPPAGFPQASGSIPLGAVVTNAQAGPGNSTLTQALHSMTAAQLLQAPGQPFLPGYVEIPAPLPGASLPVDMVVYGDKFYVPDTGTSDHRRELEFHKPSVRELRAIFDVYDPHPERLTTKLMRLNSRLCSEIATILYEEYTFEIHIHADGIDFLHYDRIPTMETFGGQIEHVMGLFKASSHFCFNRVKHLLICLYGGNPQDRLAALRMRESLRKLISFLLAEKQRIVHIAVRFKLDPKDMSRPENAHNNIWKDAMGDFWAQNKVDEMDPRGKRMRPSIIHGVSNMELVTAPLKMLRTLSDFAMFAPSDMVPNDRLRTLSRNLLTICTGKYMGEGELENILLEEMLMDARRDKELQLAGLGGYHKDVDEVVDTETGEVHRFSVHGGERRVDEGLMAGEGLAAAFGGFGGADDGAGTGADDAWMEEEEEDQDMEGWMSDGKEEEELGGDDEMDLE